MNKHFNQTLALGLSMAMALSLNAGIAFADEEADVSGASSTTSAVSAITIDANAVTYGDGYSALASYVTAGDSSVTIKDLNLTSDNYSFTGVYSTNSSTVNLENCDITLDVGSAIEGDEEAGVGTYADSGVISLKDCNITVNGAGRYTVAAESTATMVCNDSSIIAGGDLGANGNTSNVAAPASNAGLLISGTSRSNFSVGASHTFYYNSLCVAEGWAALSTDSAAGDGLEFVGYNTEAVALHGGYDIYADSSCRDYLYGVDFVSAEVGIIVSNNGEVHMDSTAAASSASTEEGYQALANIDGDTVSEDTDSVIVAGRNDFQLHSPDMGGGGGKGSQAVLDLSNTTLVTNSAINSSSGYNFKSDVNGETYNVVSTCDYYETYSDAVGKYIDFVTGAAILIKSTGSDITLDDVAVHSSTGVAIMSVLNSDSMSRYLKTEGYDQEVAIANSEIDGDIVHDDYQRDMYITTDNSTITSNISYMTASEWNTYWADYATDSNCYWLLDNDTYITDTHDTTLTLTNGSVWNAVGTSELTTLTVSADSKVNGTITADSTETATDGSTVYTNAVVVGTSEHATYADTTDTGVATANNGGSSNSNTSTDTAATDAKGDTITQGKVTYTITNVSKKTVAVTGLTAAGKKAKKLTIQNTVKSDNGVTYTVTAIKGKALANAKKL
ncbi:MAG: hypothetical protein K5840_06745, partial [Eubacterium sp.]|nr:hypothetical protein [Eubacterium sp.]